MNESVSVSLATLELRLPGCKSLKEKRGMLQPLLNRLHKDFNVSVSEIARLDDWDTALIGCALVSNDRRHNQQRLAQMINFVTTHFPEFEVVSDHIENR